METDVTKSRAIRNIKGNFGIGRRARGELKQPPSTSPIHSDDGLLEDDTIDHNEHSNLPTSNQPQADASKDVPNR